MHKHTFPTRRTGFTLLEVVIALAILSIGILAVARIFPGAKLVVEHAAQRTMAQTLAEKVLGEFRSDPNLLASAYKISTSFSHNSFDITAKPCDEEDRGLNNGAGQVPCNPGPVLNSNGVDEIVRVIGESYRVDTNFTGYLTLRFPPFAATVSTDPDVRSPRVCADVTLTPPAWIPNKVATDTAPSSPLPWNDSDGDGIWDALETAVQGHWGFAYNPLRPTGGNPNGGRVFVFTQGPIVGPGTAMWAPLGNYTVAMRVFRCSYQWRDNVTGAVHHVVDERNRVSSQPAISGTQWYFRLQAAVRNDFSELVVEKDLAGVPVSSPASSLRVVEEVDLGFRWNLNSLPLTDSSSGILNFYAGDQLTTPLPAGVSSFFGGIPVDTLIKVDYGIGQDVGGKRWRWITEDAEVPSSGTLKLAVRPLDSGRPFYIVNQGTGVTTLIPAGVSRMRPTTAGACPDNGCIQLDLPCDSIVPPAAGSLPAGICAVDYEKGEIHFNLASVPAKTPLRITYKPVQDWIVQVSSAPKEYVPAYASFPFRLNSTTPPLPNPNLADPAIGYQRFREFASADGATRVVGFHRSEIGKSVSVDYVDAAGRTQNGKVHTITTSPNPNPTFADFPGEVFLLSTDNAGNPAPYRRLLRVAGVSVRVRVLWGERNNYREVAASGTVGVEK